VTEKVICPHCHEEVEAGWLCSKCGQPLSTSSLLVDDPLQSPAPSSTETPPTQTEQHSFESPADAIEDEPEIDVSAPAEPQTSAADAVMPEETGVFEPLVDQPEIEEEEPIGETAQTVAAEEEPITDDVYDEPEVESVVPPTPAASSPRDEFALPSLSEVIGRVRLFFTFTCNTPDV
jgi:hypothetical protein